MGCDIHSFIEKHENGEWVHKVVEFDKPDWMNSPNMEPFGIRNYNIFSFLAGVRNGYFIKPISPPKGLPKGLSDAVAEEHERWGVDGHNESWLYLKELVEFDYDKSVRTLLDPAIIVVVTSERPSYRKFLGTYFFKDLETLKTVGDPEEVRIVFWFDN